MPFRKKKSKEEETKVDNDQPKRPEPEFDRYNQVNPINEVAQEPHEQPQVISKANTPSENNIGSESNQPIEMEQIIQKETERPLTADEANAEINQLLLSIVSGFSDYFIDVAPSIFEKKPHNFNFDSIRSDR